MSPWKECAELVLCDPEVVIPKVIDIGHKVKRMWWYDETTSFFVVEAYSAHNSISQL